MTAGVAHVSRVRGDARAPVQECAKLAIVPDSVELPAPRAASYGVGLLPVRVAPTASISTLEPPLVLFRPALQKATTPFVARMPSAPVRTRDGVHDAAIDSLNAGRAICVGGAVVNR